MSDTFLQILASPRVTAPTRKALTSRLQSSEPQPDLLDAAARCTFDALVARLFEETNDPGGAHIRSLDLAARLEQDRANGPGKGWRYDTLPAAAEALAQGLSHLDAEAIRAHELPFAELSPSLQDALIHDLQQGQFSWAGLDALRWFEELLGDTTTLYVSHPDTMMAIGFDGFADQPDGWSDIGLDNTQRWEPQAEAFHKP